MTALMSSGDMLVESGGMAGMYAFRKAFSELPLPPVAQGIAKLRWQRYEDKERAPITTLLLEHFSNPSGHHAIVALPAGAPERQYLDETLLKDASMEVRFVRLK
ncbi:hypothetical protein [Marinobacter mangrovi]|uniref:hypothetical protein n=1 Tax=Marinobacter mangrovi TaxID=2803918 RepID=UPI001931A9A7|nr:hypothetical protein [Marinobacter mangrovi]